MEALEEEQSAFRGYFDLMMRTVTAGKPGEPQPASADAQAALRMLERSRETRFGMPRAVSLDADASKRIDALLAQMADRSLKISTLLARKLDDKQAMQLDTLQLELSRLRIELDRERTVAAAGRARASGPPRLSSRPWRDVAPHAVQLSYALGYDTRLCLDPRRRRLARGGAQRTPEVIEGDLTELATFDAQRRRAVRAGLAGPVDTSCSAGPDSADSNALDIVAEGRIASVPFAGLNSPSDPGAGWWRPTH